MGVRELFHVKFEFLTIISNVLTVWGIRFLKLSSINSFPCTFLFGRSIPGHQVKGIYVSQCFDLCFIHHHIHAQASTTTTNRYYLTIFQYMFYRSFSLK